MAIEAALGVNLMKSYPCVFFLRLLFLTGGILSFSPQAQATLYYVILEGLGGTATYTANFSSQRSQLEAAAASLPGTELKVFLGEEATREVVRSWFEQLKLKITTTDSLALFLLGHGSFDGEQYKFNVPEIDITGEDLHQILTELPGGPHLLVNTSSASGALLELFNPQKNTSQRINNNDTSQQALEELESSVLVITATRNGNEKNATLFGSFFTQALSLEAADLDKNLRVSAQEAFDYANAQVEAVFKEENRLSTEHSQLLGPEPKQFNLARLDEQQIATEGSRLAQLLSQQESVEARIEDLQRQRSTMVNSEYLQALQTLILEAARIGEDIDQIVIGIDDPAGEKQ